MIDRAIGVAGVGVTLIFGVLLILFPNVNRKFAWAGLAVGVLLLGAAAGIAFFPESNAQQPTVTGNCNNFGNNNFNCNTLVAPSRAVFTPQLGADLLAHMPIKKKISLMTVGGGEDQRVGDDFERFLSGKGYSIERMRSGVLSPPPDRPFTFTDTPDAYVVTIAPSAR